MPALLDATDICMAAGACLAFLGLGKKARFRPSG